MSEHSHAAEWARQMQEATPEGDPPVLQVGRVRSGQWRLRGSESARPTLLGLLRFVGAVLLRSLPVAAVLVLAPLDAWWCFAVWSFCVMCMAWHGHAVLSRRERVRP